MAEEIPDAKSSMDTPAPTDPSPAVPDDASPAVLLRIAEELAQVSSSRTAPNEVDAFLDKIKETAGREMLGFERVQLLAILRTMIANDSELSEAVTAAMEAEAPSCYARVSTVFFAASMCALSIGIGTGLYYGVFSGRAQELYTRLTTSVAGGITVIGLLGLSTFADEAIRGWVAAAFRSRVTRPAVALCAFGCAVLIGRLSFLQERVNVHCSPSAPYIESARIVVDEEQDPLCGFDRYLAPDERVELQASGYSSDVSTVTELVSYLRNHSKRPPLTRHSYVQLRSETLPEASRTLVAEWCRDGPVPGLQSVLAAERFRVEILEPPPAAARIRFELDDLLVSGGVRAVIRPVAGEHHDVWPPSCHSDPGPTPTAELRPECLDYVEDHDIEIWACGADLPAGLVANIGEHGVSAAVTDGVWTLPIDIMGE